MINKSATNRTKCRGIDRATGEWIYGYYVCLNDKEHRIYSGYAETDCGSYYPDYRSVDPETISWTTGRHDVHDKEIFEGDVIRVNGCWIFAVSHGVFGGSPNVDKDKHGYIGFGFVPFDEYTKKQVKYGLRTDLVYWLENDSCEVVGNIYNSLAENL